MSSVNLLGAILSLAQLIDANLSRSDLSNADLFAADLYTANLIAANLEGAVLTNANLFDSMATCLIGCPTALPEDHTCEADPACEEQERYRIVSE